jgi:hypothetical protein
MLPLLFAGVDRCVVGATAIARATLAAYAL